MKRALIFWGGWDGHQPESIARRFQSELATHAIEATLSDTLSCLDDAEALHRYDVIIPYWTMGSLTPDQTRNLTGAIREGVALAGAHGGTGDAFRGNTDYEWMVGGHFVSHPHVGDYTVRLTARQSPITDGLPLEFPYRSEQYYMLVDPANDVLADSIYTYEGRRCVMPVAWTKTWGKGRVFYSSLGHDPKEFDDFPPALEMIIRGIRWAAEVL